MIIWDGKEYGINYMSPDGIGGGDQLVYGMMMAYSRAEVSKILDRTANVMSSPWHGALANEVRMYIQHSAESALSPWSVY